MEGLCEGKNMLAGGTDGHKGNNAKEKKPKQNSWLMAKSNL